MKHAVGVGSCNGRVRGWDEGATRLHEQRLDVVTDHLLAGHPRTVIDLGCGAGALLERLIAHPQLVRIIGIDQSALALSRARWRLLQGGGLHQGRVSLVQSKITELEDAFGAPDAAALVEVLEHLDPGRLSGLENAVFRRIRPGRVVMTTPNREYNVVYGLSAGELRHPHHRFEWDRSSFERWTAGVAERNGYTISFEGVGPTHALFGSPTQLAVFRRTDT